MNFRTLIAALTCLFCISFPVNAKNNAQTINIATVNNVDMLTLKELSTHFTEKNPEITINWNIFTENELRNIVTHSVSNKKSDFDVVTLGIYEVQLWAKNNWLMPLENFDDSFDINDIFPPIRYGLSWNNTLYASPFYAEGAMVMYRTDLFAKTNLNMPNRPNWRFIKEAANAMHDPDNGVNGICLRGKAGWGENMAILTAMANSFGARWFDENWQAQFDSDEWRSALIYYYALLRSFGPKSASENGFNENLNLYKQGKCAIWIDATVAGSLIQDKTNSIVADNTGYALAPDNDLGKNSNWLWAWSLAIPVKSEQSPAANKFIRWATSKTYTQLVAKYKGWSKVPPGTRHSLYKNKHYLAVSPFAAMTLASIKSANSIRPTVKPVPYLGIQYVAVPEFQQIGSDVGKLFSSALAGDITIREALHLAQKTTNETMARAQQSKANNINNSPKK